MDHTPDINNHHLHAPHTVGTVNISGLNRKRALLNNLLLSHTVSMLSITETKLNHPLKISNYNAFQRNSSIRSHRGVALLIHQSIPSKAFPLPAHLQELECIAATVYIEHTPVYVFSYYNPPSHPSTLSSPLFNYISTLPHFIILGDFNARHIQFGDTTTNRNGQILSDVLTNLPIHRIYNTSPTFFSHQGSSIIDHILISENLIQHFDNSSYIASSVSSDHLPLLTKSSLNCVIPPLTTSRTIRDLKNTNWTRFQNALTQKTSTLPNINSTQDIDTAIEELTNSILTTIEDIIPTKTINHKKPALPPYIVNIIKHKRRIYREYLTTRDPNIKTEWNRLNALIRRESNKFKEEKWISTTSSLDYRDGKKYWNQFKTLTSQNQRKPIHLTTNNGTISSDNQEVANLFANHLNLIHTTPQNELFNDGFYTKTHHTTRRFFTVPPPISLNDQDPLLHPATNEEISTIIKNGRNSAPGEDSISRTILKKVPDNTINTIRHIVNKCLSHAYFPAPWKTAITIMLPKPNSDPLLPSSYRPISLLPVMGKILEKILTDRLQSYTENFNLLPPFQFGFRKSRSTTDALVKLQTDVSQAINTAHCTLAVFLDIEKAFDKVWHSGLIQKLLNMRLPVHFIHLIASFLSNRTIKIKIQNSLSPPIHPSAGVPQGSILSPLLYIIYARDIPRPTNEKTKITLFADDTAIWTSHPTTAACSKSMSQYLKEFETWCKKWRITPNPNKTQSILFRHPQFQRKYTQSTNNIDIKLWNKKLTLQKQAKYLGITFSNTLSWNHDLHLTIKKAKNRSNLLYALRGKIKGCHPKTLTHTYKTYIRPIFDYRAVTYSTIPSKLLKQIQSFERATLRKIHRLPNTFPSNEIHITSNTPPITDRLTILQSKYVKRTLSSTILPAKTTLLTPPTLNNPGRPPPRKPKKKMRHPPYSLLQRLEDPPEAIEALLDNAPLIFR